MVHYSIQNTEFTEWLRLAESLECIWPNPCSNRANMSMVPRMAFEDLWGGRLHNFSGQPVTLFNHLHSEKVFPCVQTGPPMLQFVPIASWIECIQIYIYQVQNKPGFSSWLNHITLTPLTDAERILSTKITMFEKFMKS